MSLLDISSSREGLLAGRASAERFSPARNGADAQQQQLIHRNNMENISRGEEISARRFGLTGFNGLTLRDRKVTVGKLIRPSIFSPRVQFAAEKSKAQS